MLKTHYLSLLTCHWGLFFALDNTDFQTLEFEGCVFPPFLLLS